LPFTFYSQKQKNYIFLTKKCNRLEEPGSLRETIPKEDLRTAFFPERRPNWGKKFQEEHSYEAGLQLQPAWLPAASRGLPQQPHRRKKNNWPPYWTSANVSAVKHALRLATK
jgi:hypothetical protein